MISNINVVLRWDDNKIEKSLHLNSIDANGEIVIFAEKQDLRRKEIDLVEFIGLQDRIMYWSNVENTSRHGSMGRKGAYIQGGLRLSEMKGVSVKFFEFSQELNAKNVALILRLRHLKHLFSESKDEIRKIVGRNAVESYETFEMHFVKQVLEEKTQRFKKSLKDLIKGVYLPIDCGIVHFYGVENTPRGKKFYTDKRGLHVPDKSVKNPENFRYWKLKFSLPKKNLYVYIPAPEAEIVCIQNDLYKKVNNFEV